MSDDERVQLADADNRDAGSAPRAVVRRDNLIHRAAYIFVLSPLGSLCVQRRSADKDIYPDYWDLAAGGVVGHGESPDTTAERELKEELGIRDQPLTPHGEFFYHNDLCQVWGHVYACLWDGEILPQASEIADWRYLSPEDVGAFIRERAVTPTTMRAYETLLNLETGSLA
ncbi:MAG: NUDIX hydrolase [Pseudomonadota bacterium]